MLPASRCPKAAIGIAACSTVPKGLSFARLYLKSALARVRVHYFGRPLVDWLRMQVPKTLGHRFGRFGVGGNGGRNCHGGDVDAFPLETLKSAERQRSDTRLPTLREMSSEFGASERPPPVKRIVPERRSLIC
jgi:hypothetical protein